MKVSSRQAIVVVAFPCYTCCICCICCTQTAFHFSPFADRILRTTGRAVTKHKQIVNTVTKRSFILNILKYNDRGRKGVFRSTRGTILLQYQCGANNTNQYMKNIFEVDRKLRENCSCGRNCVYRFSTVRIGAWHCVDARRPDDDDVLCFPFSCFALKRKDDRMVHDLYVGLADVFSHHR